MAACLIASLPIALVYNVAGERSQSAIPHLAGMEAGWTQSLERFEAYMAHAREDAA